MNGKHTCDKSKNDPTYSNRWSGVSYAPHSNFLCEICGEQLHAEGENGDCLYCPKCDDFRHGKLK